MMSSSVGFFCEVITSDFEQVEGFSSNTNSILFEMKKATFGKVLLARTIAIRIEIDNIPEQINEVLGSVKDFSSPSNFVRK